MSAVSNSADVPTMYRITLPRRVDYAKELIYDLMKKFGAEQMDIDFVNYSEKYPYEDKNEMDKEECNKLYKYFCEQRENSK